MDLQILHLARDLALNIAGIIALAYGLYFRRHGRRELLVGYVAFNICLFSVAAALGSAASVTIGFGFGLFAVLSIVRLRSDEANSAEIGYTMSALVLGLLMGLPEMQFLLKVIFAVLIVTAMFVVDSPNLIPVGLSQRHRVRIERVITDVGAIATELEGRLGASVRSVTIREIDFVREITDVDVFVHRRPSVAFEPVDRA